MTSQQPLKGVLLRLLVAASAIGSKLMYQNEHSSIGEPPPGGGPGLFKRAANICRTFALRFSIERELAEEVTRSRQALESLRQSPPSKKVRYSRRAQDNSRKPKKSFAGRALPSVLTKEPHLTILEKISNRFSALVPLVFGTSSWLRTSIGLSPRDLAGWTEDRIFNHDLKINACQKLLDAAIKTEQSLRIESQKKRREADKLLRRAARQKDKNHPVIKKAAALNQDVTKLERSASKFSELQKLRVPLLQKRLAKLETQWQERQILFQAKRDKLTAQQPKLAEQLIERSRTSGVSGEFSRVEKRVLRHEALAAEQLRALGGELRLSANFFEPMEKKVAEAEALAKASTEMLEKIHWVDINQLCIAELDKERTALVEANVALMSTHDDMLSIEKTIEEALSDIEAQAKTWKEREEGAAQQNNTELMQQAKLRKDAYVNLALELGLLFEGHQEKTIAIKRMIEKLEQAAALIASRMKEIDRPG